MESPSAGEFTELADELLSVADEIEEDLSLEELVELLRAVCSHPVSVFLRRVCDLVTVQDGGDDA